ncbi:MAG TPA: cytochrome D1 domain-containing protein, partial [Terriglobia bacterium]|nr:cytochrome D1 domain-containing protein [Terriglobia bacterium]
NTTHMVVLSQDGDTLFTANIGSDTVSVLHRKPAGDWQITNIAVGKGPEGIDLSPTGKELWVAQSQDGGVSIIDVAAQKVTQTLALHTRRSNRLKFTPDGKLVLISDLGGGDVVVIDSATRREVKRLHVEGQPEGILMQPDGARAYVALWEDNVVAILDLAELKLVGKISTGKGPDGMAWIR